MLARPRIEDGFKTSEAARIALYVALDAIDEYAVTREALARAKLQASQECDRFAETINQIEKHAAVSPKESAQ